MATILFILLRPNINTLHAVTTEHRVCDKITYRYDAILTHNVYFNNERTQTIHHTKECYKTFYYYMKNITRKIRVAVNVSIFNKCACAFNIYICLYEARKLT